MSTDLKAALLVGGLGTRLRAALPGTPKALASVGNRPFLDLLVSQLSSQGIRRLVMCTGHLAEQIETEFTGGRFDVEIEFSRESSPLGTAGAIKLAKSYLENEEEFLVLNGDSFVEMAIDKLIQFHREKKAIASIAAVTVPDASRFGTMLIAANGRLEGFLEKTGQNKSGTINAGVYVFRREVLDFIPDGPSSLERDIIPKLLDRGVYALDQGGLFIDIGTPDDYAKAKSIEQRLARAAHGTKRALQ